MDGSLGVLGARLSCLRTDGLRRGGTVSSICDLEPRRRFNSASPRSPYREAVLLSLPGNPISFIECDGHALRKGVGTDSQS